MDLPKPTSASSGALGAAVTVAGNDILPAAGKLQSTGMSLLDQYQNELQDMLSTDPSRRMEANAPLIAQQTSLAEGERAQVKNMPRGGAQAYESGLIDQGLVTNIGNALSKSWSDAQQQLAQLAQFETTTGLQSDIQAAGIDISAAGGYNDLAKLVASGDASTLSSIASAASFLGGL